MPFLPSPAGVTLIGALCMFNLTTQSKIYLREAMKFKIATDFGEDFAGLRFKTLFLPTYQRQNLYIEDFVYILN